MRLLSIPLVFVLAFVVVNCSEITSPNPLSDSSEEVGLAGTAVAKSDNGATMYTTDDPFKWRAFWDFGQSLYVLVYSDDGVAEADFEFFLGGDCELPDYRVEYVNTWLETPSGPVLRREKGMMYALAYTLDDWLDFDCDFLSDKTGRVFAHGEVLMTAMDNDWNLTETRRNTFGLTVNGKLAGTEGAGIIHLHVNSRGQYLPDVGFVTKAENILLHPDPR
jgi:hypothetical protein